MSDKNHKQIDGRLIQTNKKYSQLKLKQKELIASWMYEETKAYYDQYEKIPEGEICSDIVERIYDRIETAGIWIPFGEVYRRYMKRRADITRKVKRELGQSVHKESEPACFMNLCMIQDEDGNVLALNQADESRKSIIFPGGYVEKGETFTEAVIREVQEKTGLIIKNPKLCGICHWTKVGIRKVVFLYRTKEFEAEPDNSKGNEVYWISEKEIPSQDLAPGMEQAWKIMQSDNGGECSVRLELAD